MAIAVDASTPALTHLTTGTAATLTSNSFSPPGSSLVLLCAIDDDSASTTSSVTDSLGSHLNWTKLVEATTAAQSNTAFWIADVPASAPGSMTATVTWSTSLGLPERAIVILVLTGTAPVSGQTGHTATHTSTTASIPSLAVSAAAVDSWIFGAVANFTNTTVGTAGTSQTQTFNSLAMSYTDAANGDSGWFQGNTGPGNSNLTINVTAGSIQWSGVVAEILAASGGAAAASPTFMPGRMPLGV